MLVLREADCIGEWPTGLKLPSSRHQGAGSIFVGQVVRKFALPCFPGFQLLTMQIRSLGSKETSHGNRGE